MSLIRKHGAVLQAWACLDLVRFTVVLSRLRSSFLAPKHGEEISTRSLATVEWKFFLRATAVPAGTAESAY